MKNFEELNQQASLLPAEGVSRRAVLGVTAGALITFTLAPFFSKSFLEKAEASGSGGSINGFVNITASNQVQISFGGAEMGQGIMTGLSQALAEELMVDWAQVTTVMSDAGANSYVTGGSYGIRGHFDQMRNVGATARQMLLQAAGPGAVALGSGQISVGGVTKSYAELASVAATQVVSAPALMAPANFKIIGKPLARTDIPSKTDGSAKFGLDTRLPGMVFAAIVNSPKFGGYLAASAPLPATPAGCLAVVKLPNANGVVDAVAVVATNTWNAMKGASSLSVSWTNPTTAVQSSMTSSAILARAQSLMTSGTAVTPIAEQKPNGSNASTTWNSAPAANRVDLQYQLPYLAHVTMEVPNCTVKLSSGGSTAEVWVPTQAPTWVQGSIAAATGATSVTVHPTLMGGGLGRRIDTDYVYQAGKLALLYGKPNNVPVQLMWPREQDLSHDQYRPSSLIRIRMAWDANKAISAYYLRMVAPSPLLQRGWTQSGSPENDNIDGAKDLVYNFGSNLVEYVVHDSPVPVGFWRSVGNSMNCFAVESALDEVAVATGQNPLTMRQNLLSTPDGARLLACLNTVAAQINSTPLPTGNGRGFAVSNGFGSNIAMAIELAPSTVAGTVKIVSIFAAVDCGLAVNPSQVETQIQGGIIQGLSAALWGQTTFSNGAASSRNFSNTRVLRMTEVPQISVSIINSGIGNLGGIGEIGVPVAAPALANAYYAMSKTRVRNLPMFPNATMGG